MKPCKRLVYILALICGVAQAAERATQTMTGTVIGITDGDTLTLLDEQNAEYKIRLDGIDAPEKNQPFGTKSKESLSELVMGQAVAVEWKSKDRYGRIIGVVLLNGDSVNQQQVDRGWAWHFVKYSDSEKLATAERSAREARLGLWVEESPVPPWEFRALKKNKDGQRPAKGL